MTYTTCPHCGKIKKRMDVKGLILKDVIRELANASKVFLKAESELNSLIRSEKYLQRRDWSTGPVSASNALTVARKSIAETALNVTRFVKNLKEKELELEGRAIFEPRSGIMSVSRGRY